MTRMMGLTVSLACYLVTYAADFRIAGDALSMIGTPWPPISRHAEIINKLNEEHAEKLAEQANGVTLEEVNDKLGISLNCQERIALEIMQKQHKAEQEEAQRKEQQSELPASLQEQCCVAVEEDEDVNSDGNSNHSSGPHSPAAKR